MKRGRAKFESNKIIQNQVNNLVAEKLIKNMNFVKVNLNEGDTVKDKTYSTNAVYGVHKAFPHSNDNLNFQLNASDVMKNLNQSRKSFLKVESHTRNPNNSTYKSGIFSSQNVRSRSSQKIATDFQNSMFISKKDSSFYDTLMNNSNELGYRSSKLGKSLLDVSQNRSRQGVSKERKLEESVLKYEDYIKEKPRNTAINFSYADENQSRFVNNLAVIKPKPQAAFSKAQLLEEFLNKNLGTKVKLEEIKLRKYSDVVVGSKKESKDNLEIAKKQKKETNTSSSKPTPTPKTKTLTKSKPTINPKSKINTKPKQKNNVNIFDLKISKDKITKDEIAENKKENIEDPLTQLDQVNYGTNSSFKDMSEILPSENYSNKKKSSFYKKDLDKDISPIESQGVTGTVSVNPTLENDIKIISNTIKNNQINNSISNCSDECGDVDEFQEEQSGRINKVYKTASKVKIEEINENDTVLKEDGGLALRQYDEILSKYLFSNNDISNSSFSNINNLNDSHISKSDLLDKDLDSVLSGKKSRKKMKLYYQKEIKKLEKELKDLEDIRNAEFDKIRERKEKEIAALKEKLVSGEEDKNLTQKDKANKSGKNSNNDTVKVLAELETLKSNLQLKENNYKNTIKSLLNEIKNSSSISNIALDTNANANNNSESIDINEYDFILKEINEVLEDSVVDEGLKNTSVNLHSGINVGNSGASVRSRKEVQISNPNNSTSLNTKSKIEVKTSSSLVNKIDNFDEDSMIAELEDFKLDDLSNYTFEIPLKYQISKHAKVESEDKRNDGKVVKYYDNAIVEIISRNKNVTRVSGKN